MSGYSENITCPYCGFEGAQWSHESNGIGRGIEQYCDICGYYEYEPTEDYENWKEDGMHAGMFPPDDDVIDKAKEVAEWIELPWEDEVFENIQDMLITGEIPKFIKEGNIEKTFIKKVFL